MRIVVCLLGAAGLIVPAELPVREIVLFKNGVAFVERSGDVPAGETARLEFKESEMNDVLKSLTVSEATGNAVTAVRYPSAEPLEQKLAPFPFETTSFASFLSRLQGARLKIAYGSEQLAGRIVLARAVPATKDAPEKEQLVLLLDSGVIKTIDLSGATSIQFEDPSLEQQLRSFLRIMSESRSQDKRQVTIEAVTGAARKLLASYIVPAPIWKSSYRLLFADKATEQSSLEGWAIVDNTTGEDWKGVRLALVSGRPVSFISNLYEPRMMERVVADLPENQAIAPELYESAVAENAMVARDSMVVGGGPGGTPGGVIGGIMGSVPNAAPPPPPARKAAPQFERTAPRANTARDLGDLFEYRFSQPVTIAAGESTMIPFLQQKLGVRRLSVYSGGNLGHPMSAAELTNSTGKTLDGGPIAVFDQDSYTGEALMSTLKANEKRLISYALDLGTKIAEEEKHVGQSVKEIHVRNGVLVTRSAERTQREYKIRNTDAKAKTLIIEHPLRSGYELINQKPTETTATAHRFEIKLAPNARETFQVIEEMETENITSVVNFTSATLLTYVQNRQVPEAGRKQLERLAGLKQQLEQAQSNERTIDADTQSLFRDQDRLRQNIQTLNGVPGQQDLFRKYAGTLSEQEARLAEMRIKRGEQEKLRQDLQRQVDDLIRQLDF